VNEDPFSLAGRRLLVTGASSGLGRAIAIACASRGARIVATGRDEPRLAKTRAELAGEGHATVAADLNDAAGRDQVVAAAGTLDGVVHSAGISRLSPMRLATPQHLADVWKINYEAPMLLTQKLLAKNQVAANGSILFMSSIAAYIGVAGVGAYSGTKAALIATMRCMAMEVAKRGIRVNCLAPALVETPLLAATETVVASLDEQRAAYPLGFGKPADVANAAVFFLCGASRWITGTTLVMDGGLTIS
jgi:NAD(P)-dependent dehydrogenase (short-subunit alcohol dehydrogenase family)